MNLSSQKRLDINILNRINKLKAQNKLLRLLIDADSKHLIYGDTDSIILPKISEEEVLDIIRKLSDTKNMILVTGKIGMGKTSLAIRLSEVLKQNTPLIFNYAVLKECTIFPHDNKDIAVFRSFSKITPYLFHRVGLLFNVWHLDREKKEMEAKFYIFGEEKQFIEVIKAYSTTIPFCSLTNYEKYREGVLEFLK